MEMNLNRSIHSNLGNIEKCNNPTLFFPSMMTKKSMNPYNRTHKLSKVQGGEVFFFSPSRNLVFSFGLSSNLHSKPNPKTIRFYL